VRWLIFEGHETSPSWTMHVGLAPGPLLALGKHSSPVPHFASAVPVAPEHVTVFAGARSFDVTLAAHAVGGVPLGWAVTETGKGSVALRSVQAPDVTARGAAAPVQPAPECVSTEPAHEPPDGAHVHAQVPPPDFCTAVDVGYVPGQPPAPKSGSVTGLHPSVFGRHTRFWPHDVSFTSGGTTLPSTPPLLPLVPLDPLVPLEPLGPLDPLEPSPEPLSVTTPPELPPAGRNPRSSAPVIALHAPAVSKSAPNRAGPTPRSMNRE
jgi:hypothetical protein